MASDKTFQPVENDVVSYSVNVTTSAANAQGSLLVQYPVIRVHNNSNVPVSVRWGVGAQTAVTTDMSMPAGGVETFTKGEATHIAAICHSAPTGTSTLNITHGDGI
jgi:hypothetical protein